MEKNNLESTLKVTRLVEGVHDKLRRTAQRQLGAEALKGATAEEVNQHIAETAQTVSNTFIQNNREQHIDFPVLQLTGVVSDTIRELPALEKGSKDAKDQMIEFNTALKTIIRNQTGIPPEQLIYMVRGVAKSLGHNHREIAALSARTHETVRGMKHELAAESVFMNLPEEYNYREGTAKEDRKGIDYVVTAPNGIDVLIDVKASERAARDAWDKQDDYYARRGQKVPQNHLIMASGYREDDFLPKSWNVNYEATKELTPGWKQVIDHAAGYVDLDEVYAPQSAHDRELV
ncbi:MAG: hypothetical protein ACTJG2_04000 [Candidatus Saccharimonadales bacterium]